MGLEELQKSGIVDGTKDPADWSQQIAAAKAKLDVQRGVLVTANK